MDYRKWKASCKLGMVPAVRPSSRWAQRFTQLRNAPGNEWLQDYNHEIVRYARK